MTYLLYWLSCLYFAIKVPKGNALQHGRQTHIRGLPLMHHTRSPLRPHHEVIFVEAVKMRAIADTTEHPEIRKAFSRHIDFFVSRLQPAVLTGAHVMSGHSVDQRVLQRQQDVFWRNNINHAAAFLANCHPIPATI